MTRKEIPPTLHPRTGRSGYQLTVPLTESEYWAVVHRARALSIARSEYVRRAMFGEYGSPDSDPYCSYAPMFKESIPDDKRPA